MMEIQRQKAFEYTTRENDMVDLILFKHFGEVPRLMVEQVIEINPFLADYDFKLPIGLKILIPIDKPVVFEQPLQIWN